MRRIPVVSQTRIPLVANGTVDLECGSTTNTLTRQKQVAYAPITYITATKLLVKKSAKIKSYKDLKGKTVVVTGGGRGIGREISLSLIHISEPTRPY